MTRQVSLGDAAPYFDVKVLIAFSGISKHLADIFTSVGRGGRVLPLTIGVWLSRPYGYAPRPSRPRHMARTLPLAEKAVSTRVAARFIFQHHPVRGSYRHDRLDDLGIPGGVAAVDLFHRSRTGSPGMTPDDHLTMMERAKPSFSSAGGVDKAVESSSRGMPNFPRARFRGISSFDDVAQVKSHICTGATYHRPRSCAADDWRQMSKSTKLARAAQFRAVPQKPCAKCARTVRPARARRRRSRWIQYLPTRYRVKRP